MDYITLGATGLKASVAGLGCGGNSRIGLGTGLSEGQSVALVREALDLGVNFLDTAAAYGTEEVIGKAIKGWPREALVISTKSHINRNFGPEPMGAAEVVANLDTSLRHLGTDHVDIFNLHGLSLKGHERAMGEIVPALLREKERGKLRHLGVTESGARDPEHGMLLHAADQPCWEVFMLAFHMLHQNALRALLPKTREKGIGTLCMFAVRNIFSKPAVLAKTMAELAADGRVPAEIAARKEPLDFLIHPGGAESLTDAAYRFVRHAPGIDVVLFGTGNSAHLRSNIASILRPPLPPADVQRLQQLFGRLVGVGLDLPDRVQEATSRSA
jgi:aryl-alcohol dehydrogenase-like predicted oxidoreductase